MDRKENKLVRAYGNTPLLLVVALLLLAMPVLAKSKSYEETLESWTREGKAYNFENFEARLIWTATYQSDEFRKARVEEQVRIYQSTDVEKGTLLQKEKEDGDRYDDFFISIYAGSSVWSDVGKDTSLWKMVLTYPGGGEARPISIQKVKSNPLQRMFYPYVDKWSHTYEARFDKFLPEGLKEFSLSFVGIPATSKLVWKGLKPVPTDRGEIVRKTKTQKIR